MSPAAAQSAQKDCSVYVHVPFCVRKCRYCSFYSIVGDSGLFESYLNTIEKELSLYSDVGQFATAYVGGGSPTALDRAVLLDLCGMIRPRLAAGGEWTVEVNPGQTNRDLLSALRAAGVNRLSVGAQSFAPFILDFLGRIHTVQDIYRTIEDARKAGFENIGIDLISAVPGLTQKQWKQTIATAAGLDIQHLSAYALTIEEDTPFAVQLATGDFKAVDESLDRAMYETTIETLCPAGFKQYEISNFAKPGLACRHNLRYWQNREFVGVGPAAASWYNRRRTENAADIAQWMDCVLRGEFAFDEVQMPDAQQIACETAILNLRTVSGICLAEFRQQTGFDALVLFAEPIGRHLAGGWLEKTAGHLRLTRKSLAVADSILCDFVEP